MLEDGEVLVWTADTSSYELITTMPGAVQGSVSSNGRWVVVTGGDGLAYLFDRTTGGESVLAEGDLPLSDAFFVPGTERIALVGDTGRVDIFDTGAQRTIYTTTPGATVWIASRNGRYVLLSRRGLGLEWIDAVGLVSHSLPMKLHFFDPVDILEDGRVVLAERANKAIKLWDPRQQKVDELLFATTGAVAATPDGHTVAALDDQSVLRVETLPSHWRHLLRGHLSALGRYARFIDATHLASTTDDGDVRVWGLTSPADETVMLGAAGFDPPFDLSRDGLTIIMAAQDGRILRRPLSGGADEELFRIEGTPLLLALSDDGSSIVVTDDRGTLTRFDSRLRSAEKLFTGVERVPRLILSPNGRFVAGTGNHSGAVYLWDLQRRKATTFEGRLDNCNIGMSYTPDGKQLLIPCATSTEHAAALVDVETGATRLLSMPVAETRIVGFSPSGHRLYGILTSGSVIRWNLDNGQSEIRRVSESLLLSGDVLSDDLLILSGSRGIAIASFSLRTSWPFDDSTTSVGIFLTKDRMHLEGTTTEYDSVYVWDLASRERWGCPRVGAMTRAKAGKHGEIVVGGTYGFIRILKQPDLAMTPAETLKWLDELTSKRVHENAAAPKECE